MAGVSDIHKQMDVLWYATITQLAILNRKDYSNETSCFKATQRSLKTLVAAGKLEQTETCYKLKTKEGNCGNHALAVTDVLVEILLKYPKSTIQREVPLKDKRCDAIVLLKDKKTMPIILEVAIDETQESLESKIANYRTLTGLNGYKHAGVLIIDQAGKINIEQEGVRVVRDFREFLEQSTAH